MKLIISILGAIVCLNAYAQNLKSNPWHIDRVIGSDLSQTNEITLKKADTTEHYWMWGNTIQFLSDGSFKCKYSAKCGNDCFPSSNGSYRLIDPSHVEIFLKEYNQEGECEEIHKIIEKTIGTYAIKKVDDLTIKLKKIN